MDIFANFDQSSNLGLLNKIPETEAQLQWLLDDDVPDKLSQPRGGRMIASKAARMPLTTLVRILTALSMLGRILPARIPDAIPLGVPQSPPTSLRDAPTAIAKLHCLTAEKAQDIKRQLLGFDSFEDFEKISLKT